MNAVYRELAERIRGEVPDLEHVIQRALASWAQAGRKPDESAYLDSVALNLHGFYSGLERLEVRHHFLRRQKWTILYREWKLW